MPAHSVCKNPVSVSFEFFSRILHLSARIPDYLTRIIRLFIRISCFLTRIFRLFVWISRFLTWIFCFIDWIFRLLTQIFCFVDWILRFCDQTLVFFDQQMIFFVVLSIIVRCTNTLGTRFIQRATRSILMTGAKMKMCDTMRVKGSNAG